MKIQSFQAEDSLFHAQIRFVPPLGGGMELNMEHCDAKSLFPAPDTTRAWAYLSAFRYPWDALTPLREAIYALGHDLPENEFELRGEGIWISHQASVAAGAVLRAPCIIEAGAELRPGAYLRGGTLVGRGAVVGNSCELKNCILFDGVQVPHFNYVGDSILGYRAHLGAGAITSNVKGDRSEIAVHIGGTKLPTGRRKLGAILGDGVEVGCNAVLNPGTVVGVGARIYPLTCVRGYVPAGCILKNTGEIVAQRG